MTRYLTVGVGQVQTWISRSPDLAGRRGASALLTETTGKAHWHHTLADTNWEWNDEAGEVAGVVALKYAGTAIGDDLDRATRHLARTVIGELRKRLPMAAVEASWADAGSYALSWPEAQRQRDAGDALASLPATVENALAQPCAECQQSAAVRSVDNYGWVCQDCAGRYAAAGNWNRAAGALQPVIDRLRGHGEVVMPRDLGALAGVGHTKVRDAATRICVVYADGNNLGHVLKARARNAGMSPIAEAVHHATVTAFTEAALHNGVHDGHIGVIPHIVGGDDVVASLSARAAWPFAIDFAQSFHSLLDGQEWLGDTKAPDVSLGLVFQHHKEPLSHTFERAGVRLGEAKKKGVAAMSWVDLQQDNPDTTHDPREVTWVADHLATARKLAAEPASLRQTLRSALTKAGDYGWSVVRDTIRKQKIDYLDRTVTSAAPRPYPESAATDLLWLLQMAKDVEPVHGLGLS